MKNVLVTGAAGFIGFHLTITLLDLGFKVYGIDNLNDYYSVKLKKVVDIAEPKLVTMKNGRKAVSGVAAEDPTSKVFRILSDKDVAEVEKMIG